MTETDTSTPENDRSSPTESHDRTLPPGYKRLVEALGRLPRYVDDPHRYREPTATRIEAAEGQLADLINSWVDGGMTRLEFAIVWDGLAEGYWRDIEARILVGIEQGIKAREAETESEQFVKRLARNTARKRKAEAVK